MNTIHWIVDYNWDSGNFSSEIRLLVKELYTRSHTTTHFRPEGPLLVRSMLNNSAIWGNEYLKIGLNKEGRMCHSIFIYIYFLVICKFLINFYVFKETYNVFIKKITDGLKNFKKTIGRIFVIFIVIPQYLWNPHTKIKLTSEQVIYQSVHLIVTCQI